MPEPRLTPQQEAEIRRLLADARHEEPIPEDVAARLDRVLEGLRSEMVTTAAVDPDPVVDLDARRRRRRTTGRLLVAAAVIVGGSLGLGHVLGGHGADTSDSGADTSRAVDRGTSGPDAASAGGADSGASNAPQSADPTSGPAALPLGQFRASLPVALTSDRLAADVRQTASDLSSLPVPAQRSLASDGLAPAPSGWTCPTPAAGFGTGTLLPATYDGSPAVLRLGPGGGGRLRADVLACDSGRILDTATVPAT